MKYIINLKIMAISFLMGTSLVLHSQTNSEFFMTETINATVTDVSIRNRTVSFNGNSYKFALDVDKSEFSPEEAEKVLVELREIDEGERYFITLFYNGDDEENAKIVFVSKTEPQS